MKRLLVALGMTTVLSSEAVACSDFLINKGGYHIEGRTLDFFSNIGFRDALGFTGDKNKTNIVVDVDKIPDQQLTSWETKYGYFGRSAFNETQIIDGMNTQGLSIAILYLPGSKYPTYDPKDSRPVLGAIDLGSYLLAQASTVGEALKLINSHQIVASAVEVEPGVFVTDIPIHYAVRDKTGASAVVEFIDGKVKVYDKAGDILTNAPAFDWQLKNSAFYDSLQADHKGYNKDFENRVYQYKEIYDTTIHPGEANLIGIPGDATPPSRFARASVLLNNFPVPSSHQVALYQAMSVLDSLQVPALNGSEPTLWVTIRDLDNLVFYYKNILVYQADKSLYPLGPGNAYTAIDLKSINFNQKGVQGIKHSIQPVNPKDIKKIIAANETPMFTNVD